MRSLLVLGFVSVGLLAGCTVKPKSGDGSDLSMNIGSEPTLLGKLYIVEVYTGMGVLEPQGLRRKSYIEASNFELSCKSPIMENYEKGPAVTYPLACNDGSKGNVTVRYRIQGRFWLEGVGQGEMEDGRRVKLIFGPQSSNLEWQ